MKKSVLSLSVIFIFLLSLVIVSAQNQTEDRAFACLEGKVKSQCASLTLEQQIFSSLALAYNSGIQTDCKAGIISYISTSQCWPKSSCTIKDTAQATLALKNINQDTSAYESWLLNRTRTPTELNWYLEIDSGVATTCTLTGGGSITISADKIISGNPGSCFSLANDNYWLQINSNCLQNTLNVSCDQGFLSTILYKTANSNVWHVTSDVKSASANGVNQHQISSLCFGLSSCDYEGTLWSVLALQKSGKDITSYMPYLIALAEDNEKLFPYTFLNLLASSDEYSQKIVLSQSTDGYWDLQSKGRFYDTALGILSNTDATSKAEDWLAKIQGTDGCWNSGNIRDTAILLWAGWPKAPASITTGSSTPNCEDYNFSCIANSDCADAGGTKLDNYWCSQGICCTKPALTNTCSDKGGQECSAGTACNKALISASDTNNCCVGTCEEQESECQSAGNYCLTECASNQVSTSETCDTGKICCKQAPKKSSLWIWILIILIILIVLGIIFRNKLKVWLFKFQNKFKKGPVIKTRPPFPPMTPIPASQRYMPQRPMPGQVPGTVRYMPQQAKAKSDKEMEETLKKLKEISK